MYRKLFFILLTAVLLVGCTANKNTTMNTPEEALNTLHAEEGFAEVRKVYTLQEVSKDRVIAVYKGMFENEEQFFVANIEITDDMWVVTEAMAVGNPSEHSLDQSISSATFDAGFFRKNTAPNPNTKIIEIGDEKYKVWVKEK